MLLPLGLLQFQVSCALALSICISNESCYVDCGFLRFWIADTKVMIVCWRLGVYQGQGSPQMALVAPVSSWSRVREYLSTAMLLGGVVYGLYYVYKVCRRTRLFYS